MSTQLVVIDRRVIQAIAVFRVDEQVNSADPLVFSGNRPVVAELALDAGAPHVIGWGVVMAQLGSRALQVPAGAKRIVEVGFIVRYRWHPSKVASLR